MDGWLGGLPLGHLRQRTSKLAVYLGTRIRIPEPRLPDFAL